MKAVLADGHDGVACIVKKEEQGRADSSVVGNKAEACKPPLADQAFGRCVIVEVWHFRSFFGAFLQKKCIFPLFFG